MIHRAELVERLKQEAMQQGRRQAAEEVLTIMARDLRTYLTPLRGRIEVLERRACQERREQDIRDTRAVNHTLGLLEQVSADLLDVAHLNQGIFAINAQPMHLMELVQDVVAAFSTAETPIHIHTPVEVVFSADPDRLRQLLENVLANAVTHAPKQTPILVQVRIEQRMDGLWMLLTVSNQGPGLPPELLSCFFHPFVASSPPTGLSLGLYLANRIAAAHGGTLAIDSPAGQGVQVTLALPVEEEEAHHARSRGIRSAPLSSRCGFEAQEIATTHISLFQNEPTLLQSEYFRPHNRSNHLGGLYFVGAGNPFRHRHSRCTALC